MNFLYLFISSFLLSFINAETHTWYYTTGWVEANPDGVYPRQMIGWNNTWPLPLLRVKKGDRVNLYLTNGFDDLNTTLHFHGLFQPGSNQMDGPEMVTQCPIPPGETFLYNFTVDQQVGAYWYHSHTSGQYGDGMRGAFIIDDDDNPYADEYDEEIVLTLSDHYHKKSKDLMPDFLNRYNPTGAEPEPDNLLFNETMNATWKIEPNKTYLLRIINVGRFVSQYIWFEDHNMTVVEVDGVYTEKNTTDMLYVTIAQRYTVLLTTKDTTDKNYAIQTVVDTSMLDIPKWLNTTNTLMYDEDLGKAKQQTKEHLDEFLDDFYLVPYNKVKLFDEPDYTITVDVQMDNLANGINYAFFNNISYTTPKVPPLLTVLSSGDQATNELIYGTNTNAFVLQGGETVDIVLNNYDTGTHPFHLHGHVFQLIERYKSIDEGDPVQFNISDHTEYPEYPMIRDTVYVRPQSYFVIRYQATNPGVWFFHCHIEWHLDQGLAIVLIEDPLGIQNNETQQLTDNHKQICEKVGVPWKGNAAGNSTDFLNLYGQNIQEKRLPTGFTARGIVALVFSCVSAILGLATIAYYGMNDIANVEERVAKDLFVDLNEDDEDEEVEQVQVEGSSSSSTSSTRKH